MENFEIPKDAFLLPKSCNPIDDIDEWFCPDCEIKGTFDTIDCVTEKDSPCHENKIVTYCCPECFEQNLYATIIQD